ncbi:unnamed protein product [Calypogeia fissa]
MEIVEGWKTTNVTIDVTDSGDEEANKVKICRLDAEVLAKAQQPKHRQFWADMGLEKFAALDWTCTTGSVEHCQQFIVNSTNEYTVATRVKIDLSELSLAKLFSLGECHTREAGLRAAKWQSKKFSGPKDKNGYKLSQCTDSTLVERLEFMRGALYMQVSKTTAPVALVREAEEVLGKSTNWSKHFHKQFHHELSLARSTKKTLLGSHIRMIFNWIKFKRGTGVSTPLPEVIPPPIAPLPVAAVTAPQVQVIVLPPSLQAAAVAPPADSIVEAAQTVSLLKTKVVLNTNGSTAVAAQTAT